MELDPNDMARLRSHASRGELVLFSGAGFSAGARDRSGNPIPAGFELTRELWQLCYPEDEFDNGSSLSDLYGAALRHEKSSLVALLQSRLTVDPDSLPEYYRTLFEFPWLRCYTLNVDDLDCAVARRFNPARGLQAISARANDPLRLPGALFSPRGLEVVHLNGVISDPPESLTFSETQYAARIGSQEPWYSRCVVDITARMVVFVGTVLNEPLLWYHMYLRARRENLGRDLRPTSILVTPALPRPRRDVLRDLRINWVEGTAEEFATQVLPVLHGEAARGLAFIRRHHEERTSGRVPLVSQLSGERPNLQTEYLLGAEPQWSDILEGRAVRRVHDEALLDLADSILDGRVPRTALAITGTAGTGKSTALMSLALNLTGRGLPVLWIDRDSEISPAAMRARVREVRDKVVLAIDDADMYGRELAGLIGDLVPSTNQFLFAFATRSSKLDAIANAVRAQREANIIEHVVPPLTDDDIDSLIAVLAKNNRLGILSAATDAVRRQAFREQAGRQLLVAMIQATSGENFEKKVHDEYVELDQAQKYPYSLIAVATSLRYSLTKDELLLAHGDSTDEALIALERLTARHLVVITPDRGEYRCRHRVVSGLVFNKLKELGELGNCLVGLAWALASKAIPAADRHSRAAKFLGRILSHDFLLNTIGLQSARDLYERLEALLHWDYHYWLQRGSLEVEAGDIRRAENFLGAARSHDSGEDFRVGTAYAYMLMRKAWEAPQDLHAEEYLASGMTELGAIIEQSGRISEYPYHVLGCQSLAWAHRAIVDKEMRRAFLGQVAETVERGLRYHAGSAKLLQLQQDLRKEILLTVVGTPSRAADLGRTER